MKHLCMLFTLLLFNSTFAQEAIKPERIRFKLGATYSPDYSYRILKADPPYNGMKGSLNESQLPLLGYTAGLSGAVYFKTGTGVETGVYYATRGERAKGTIVVPPSHFTPSITYTYNDKIVYDYLEIPLTVSYRLSKKRMSFFMSAGIGLELILKAEEEMTNTYTDRSETFKRTIGRDSFEKAYFSTLVGLGMGYKATENLEISLQPTYTQLLTAIHPKDGIREYPFSLGARVGVHYLFY